MSKVFISKPKFIALFAIALLLLPSVQAYSFSGTNLPSNTIYFDDFSNYVTPTTCASAGIQCLPGWGAYDNATGGIANITSWHPLSSSGKSLLMQSGTAAGAKFDRHKSWAIIAGQTKVSISQWFQFSQTMHTTGSNSAPSELHFSLEMIGSDGNFHECLIEYFSPNANQQFDDWLGVKDQAFNFNFTMRAFDVGGFNNNPNTLFDNYEWHYEKITMDISNPAAPTCPYMQVDNLVLSSLGPNTGWTGTPSTPASYPTAATSHVNTQYTDANGYKYSRPWRLEIAMINNGGAGTYFSWHTNILITDDSPGGTNGITLSLLNASWLLAGLIGMVTPVRLILWAREKEENRERHMKQTMAITVTLSIIASIFFIAGFFFR